MKSPKQKCPKCENPDQVFNPRWRRSGKPGVIDVFIACTMCGWEKVIRQSTPRLEKLEKILYRLQRRQVAYMETHDGNPDVAIGNLVINTLNEMDKERELIA